MTASEKEKTRALLEAASEIVGSATGAALGFMAGGPLGSVGGASLAPIASRAILRVCADIHDRFVSPREKIRVGVAAAHAMTAIEAKLKAGVRIRQDNFFENVGGRSSAEEIFEGCLLAAKKAHEERKAPYYGELFASVAFDTWVSRAEANHFIAIAEALTYQQLLILAAIKAPPLPMRATPFVGEAAVKWSTIAALNETYDMARMGLVMMKSADGATNELILDFPGIAPGRLFLSPLGQRLFTLLRLDKIPRAEVEAVAALLM